MSFKWGADSLLINDVSYQRQTLQNPGSPENEQLGWSLKRLREAWDPLGQGPDAARREDELCLRTWAPGPAQGWQGSVGSG